MCTNPNRTNPRDNQETSCGVAETGSMSLGAFLSSRLGSKRPAVDYIIELVRGDLLRSGRRCRWRRSDWRETEQWWMGMQRKPL
jgi:hypothetical protein